MHDVWLHVVTSGLKCMLVCEYGETGRFRAPTVRITGYTCKAMWLNCAALLQSQTYTLAGAALIIFHVTCLNTKVLLQTVCDLSFRIALYDSVSLKVQMFPMQTNITELATQSTKQ